MNSKTIQIFVLSAVILSSLTLASIESGFAYEWTKSLAAGLHDLAFRDITDTTPTEDPILSLDKTDYAPGDTVVITVADTIPNVDLDGADSAIAKIDGNPLTLTETGNDSDTFIGSFTLGKTFPVVEYSRSFSLGTSVDTTSDTSIEDSFAHAARASADVDVSDPGDVKISDYYWFEDPDDAVNLCFKPVIHAANIQVENGASIGSTDTSVTLSYANAFLDGESISDLYVVYQKDGSGPWQKISPTGAEDFEIHGLPVGPEYSLDEDAQTITSDPVDAGYVGQVTTGKFTLGVGDACFGGGGGGLVRPSLVVNALAGLGSFGGGSGDGVAPTLSLNTLVQSSSIEVPFEIEEMILNHDSSFSVSSMELGLYENFDYPLVINEKGFILTGFETTIETQTLTTNTPHTFKFLFYESNTLQHFSLYTNLRDATNEIHESDTQILYYDGDEIHVDDPNGFFENIDFNLNEIDDIKKEIVLDIIFAQPMDTSHMIVRSWDQNLNSRDAIILDAFQVVPEVAVESPFSSSEEPEIQELQSQIIPIWVKNNAAWWSEQQIGDSDFIAGIEYLIKNGIINVPGVEVGTSTTTEIPDWIKNNASWWSESLITDDDFIEAMQWLVAEGVIQI